MISHGTTHPLGEKCKTCDRIKREYKKDLKSGKIKKLIKLVSKEFGRILI